MIRDAGMEIIGGRGLLARYDWIYGWRDKAARQTPVG